MALIPCFIHNVYPVFIGKLQIPGYRRIMRCAYTINIVLFEKVKIPDHGFFVHGMPQGRMLHMAVDTIQLNRNPIEIKYLVSDFRFLKTNPA